MPAIEMAHMSKLVRHCALARRVEGSIARFCGLSSITSILPARVIYSIDGLTGG